MVDVDFVLELTHFTVLLSTVLDFVGVIDLMVTIIIAP
jgi:hypothetical protein